MPGTETCLSGREAVERGVDEARQRLELVAALEDGRDAVGESPAARARARGSRPRVTRMSASGSSTCASKPAETSTSSGSNRSTAGSTTARRRRGTPRRPSRPRSGTLSVVSAWSSGPAAARDRTATGGARRRARSSSSRKIASRAVAVVDVEVDDRHPLEAEPRLRRPGRDGDVVEDAEAHRAAGERVVAGRTDEREAAAQRRLDRRPGRERGSLERRRGADRVAVEPDRVVDRADELDVLGGVAEQELLGRRRAALAPDVLVREQDREPLGPLRVAAGRVQPRQRGVRQDVDGLDAPSAFGELRRGRAVRGKKTPPPTPGLLLRGEEGGRRRPSSRFAGRASSPPPPRRSGRRRAPPRASRTARAARRPSSARCRARPGSLSDGSPRSAIRSGTCSGSTP